LAREIKYGDWQKFCFKPGGAKMTCRTTISGSWETGQQAVRLDLIEREGDGSGRLQLFLPVGLYLQAGVKLTVDQGAPYSIPYTWCLTNTCIAADVADPKVIRDMETGQKLAVEVVDSNVLAVTTSLPLNQFSPVHQGAPSRTFEQPLDE
jgi:invasion protein IalB